jgi:hypothetical protein
MAQTPSAMAQSPVGDGLSANGFRRSANGFGPRPGGDGHAACGDGVVVGVGVSVGVPASTHATAICRDPLRLAKPCEARVSPTEGRESAGADPGEARSQGERAPGIVRS